MATLPAQACKIIAHQGGGLYTVEVQYDDTPRTDRIAELEAELLKPVYTTELLGLWLAWKDAETVRNDWVAAMNLQITIVNIAYSSGIAADIQREEAELSAIVTQGLQFRNAMIEAKIVYYRALSAKTVLEVERLALVRAGNPSLPLVDVWCMELADGQEGRPIYANGSYAPLVCLNYDTTQYLLPPKSYTPGGLQGVYNIMDRYRPRDAAGFTFWNAALEPGFAKWQPIFLRGKLLGRESNPACLSDPSHNVPYLVALPNIDARLGFELAHGTYDFKFQLGSAVSSSHFHPGDEVACLISNVDTQQRKEMVRLGTVNGNVVWEKKLVNHVEVTGEVVGFANNPRAPIKGTTIYSKAINFSNRYPTALTFSQESAPNSPDAGNDFSSDTRYGIELGRGSGSGFYTVDYVEGTQNTRQTFNERWDEWILEDSVNNPPHVLRVSKNYTYVNKAFQDLNVSTDYTEEVTMHSYSFPEGPPLTMYSTNSDSYVFERTWGTPYIVDDSENLENERWTRVVQKVDVELTYVNYLHPTGINDWIRKETVTEMDVEHIGNALSGTASGGTTTTIYYIKTVGCDVYYKNASEAWQSDKVAYSTSFSPASYVYFGITHNRYESPDNPAPMMIFWFINAVFNPLGIPGGSVVVRKIDGVVVEHSGAELENII